MRDIVEKLVALQGIDNEARGFQSDRDGLRQNITRLKEILALARKGLDDKKDKLADATKWYREKEQELKADQDKVAKARGKLQAVTKNKEYMAMQKEIEALNRGNATKQEEILKLLQATDEYKQSITVEQEKIAGLEAEVAAEEARNATRIAELDDRIENITSRRGAISAALKPAVTAKYNQIRDKRNGLAIAAVRKGACSGCNFSVPPQQQVRLQRVELLEQLESCRNCSRILYWEEPKHEGTGLEDA